MNTVALKSPPATSGADLLESRPATAPSWTCDTAGCDVKVLGRSRDIAPEVRAGLYRGLCKDFRYYEIVEETLGDQFDQRYFVITHRATGAVTVQPFFFVNQDLLAGLPPGVRHLVDAVRRRWPRFLCMKMMMIGCAEGDGQLDCMEPWAMDALHDAVGRYARHEKASIILMKSFPSNYRDALKRFSEDDYSRVPSMPGGRMEIDFPDFEEYMQTKLSRIFRKNLRRKFKKTTDADIRMEVTSDVSGCVEEVYALYLQTYERSEFRFEKLTREFFLRLCERMPDRARFFLWRREGKMIAFALCMVHDGLVYDMNVGMDYAVALDLHLYFLTFRDIVDWAAKNGFKHYYTGPLNYDPKLHLKLDLDPLDLYARHSSNLINPIFKIALKYLQPARHDKYIKQFRNADEIY